MFTVLQNAQEKSKKLKAVFFRKAIVLKCVERCHQFQLHLKEKIIKIEGWDGIFLKFNFLQLSLLLINIDVYITCLQFFFLHFVQIRLFKKVISVFMNWIILWFQNFHFFVIPGHKNQSHHQFWPWRWWIVFCIHNFQQKAWTECSKVRRKSYSGIS